MTSIGTFWTGLAACLAASTAIAQQPELDPVDPDYRYEGYGYSISAPAGMEWFVRTELVGHMTQFYVMPTRREAKRHHTITTTVPSFWVTGCNTTESCIDAALAEIRDFASEARFPMSVIDEIPSTGLPPGCTRVQGLQHDIGVGGDEGKTYEIHVDGMLCSHPDAPNLVLHPNYSERLREGDKRRKVDADDIETFLRGFEFRPIGPFVDAKHLFREQTTGVNCGADHAWVQHQALLSRFDAKSFSPVQSINVEDASIAFEFIDDWLWFAEYNNQKLVKLNPENGERTASLPLPGYPLDMAYLDGSLWITHGNVADIVRVDVADDVVAESIPVGTGNMGVTAAFGSVWVASMNVDKVFRIDPAANAAVAEIGVCSGPLDIVELNGFIWAGCGDGSIVKIDPVSNSVVATFQTTGSPFYIAAGDNELWFSNDTHPSVSRFDIDSGEVTANIFIGMIPAKLCTSPGQVWVVEFSSGALYRLVDNQ